MSCQGSSRSFKRPEFYFQITFHYTLFNRVMQSVTSPFYPFIFTLFTVPPQNLLFPMDHIPVYDTHSLHHMKSTSVASQYCVRNDIKLGSCPVPSSRVSIPKMLGYLLLWTFCLTNYLLHPVCHLFNILLVQFFFSFVNVTSHIPSHTYDHSSELNLGMEAGFSMYTVFISPSEDDEESDPVLVYPDEAEMSEISGDSSLSYDTNEDIIFMPNDFNFDGHSHSLPINKLIRRSTQFPRFFLKKHKSIDEFPRTQYFHYLNWK